MILSLEDTSSLGPSAECVALLQCLHLSSKCEPVTRQKRTLSSVVHQGENRMRI